MCFIDGQAQLLQYSRDLDVTVAQNRQALSAIRFRLCLLKFPSIDLNNQRSRQLVMISPFLRYWRTFSDTRVSSGFMHQAAYSKKGSVWLSREEEYAALIDNIETLPAIGDIKVSHPHRDCYVHLRADKAQEKVLMARLANHISRRQLSQEASLGSLGESGMMAILTENPLILI